MKTPFLSWWLNPAKILPAMLWLAICAGAMAAPDQPAADAAGDAGYPAQKAAAEKFYADGSYARAHDAYRQVNTHSLSGDETRWVAFRLADTQWRAAAGSGNSDNSQLEDAEHQLEVQIRDLTRDDQHDRIWAEVQESLGDYFWMRHSNGYWNWYGDWNNAWPHYQAALDWWAGQSDLDLARERYLNIVWRACRDTGDDGFGFYWASQVPLDICENAARIARTDDDRAHAHFLVALVLRNRGEWEQRARVPDEFAAAIKTGKKSGWYDAALFNYAQWLEQNGRASVDTNGNWSARMDYVGALRLFRQLTDNFTKGESRYWESAQNEIHNITRPQVGVSLGNIFLPDSEIQYDLTWRNVKQVRLALYPLDLTAAVKFPADARDQQDWLQTVDLDRLKALKSWTRETGDQGDYQPGASWVRLGEKLKPGAYVLAARAGDQSARDLVLVTDAGVILKSSSRQALVYFCNVLDGSPLAGAPVRLWESWWSNDDRQWHSRSFDATTDTNGLAAITLDRASGASRNMIQLFATAGRGAQQAFSHGGNYWSGSNPDADAWRIYAFTDRPAYRPQETAQWKFIARRYNGSVYSTPASETLEYEIDDPHGVRVKADKIRLNEFGSAWGSLDLTAQMPLGEYQINFWDEGRHHQIGGAALFRLEEYKLPEYQVTVSTPVENGQKKIFRLGDTVEATIQADYYFGGPVANADVQVLIHQKPYWHFWHEPRDYPWFYDDLDTGSPYASSGRYGQFGRRGWYGGGGDQVITNATLKTDATGKAILSFNTPNNPAQDYEYDIEARVTDASRREITGNGTVRVTSQRYYVYANPAHNLYQPGDKVTLNFKALDANDQPVAVAGQVRITRDYWYEVWLAPDGHEVEGRELRQLQAENRVWPPPPTRPDQKAWQLKFRGYGHDDILTRDLKTDTNGDVALTFTPERRGYYHVAWTGVDRTTNQPPQSIRADATVWVASRDTIDLGYHAGGVQIVADKDTFRVGGVTPVMLLTPASGGYVLFTVEGQDLYHYQLVHLDGTVKLINLPVDETCVPNMFLTATLVRDRQVFSDTKQIVVPPVKNFLNVEVKPDHAQYQPRDAGTLTVTTRDDEGRPVAAEVALGLTDESVFYIQNDYAGDPRQFFYGTKREEQVQQQSTLNERSYARLVEGKDHQLIDDREKARQEEMEKEKSEGYLDQAAFGIGGASFNMATFSGARNRYQDMSMTGGPIADGVVQTAAMGGTYSFPADSAGMVMDAPEAALPANIPEAAKLPMGRFPAHMSRLLGIAGSSGGEEPAVIVRSDFRSTVFWQPDIHTGTDGQATVKVKYPDSLTTWRATARAVATGNQFGIAQATTRTQQPLIVRLEAPRFFVVGDTATISAVVNNHTDGPLTARVKLDAQGVTVASANGDGDDTQTVTVAPDAEARADWTVEVKQPGDIKLKVTARGGHYADAMEKSFAADEHGIEKLIVQSGKAREADTTVELVLPHERKTSSTLLTVQATPSLAVTMLDALPYLIDYPYGCTEQTMSRFLPTVITAKTLRDLGLPPEDVMDRVFGGVETKSADVTHPEGKKNLAAMNTMTQASLDRLADFQHDDGGWGWWKEGDSDHWMTAYVVWGLSLARAAGVEVKSGVLDRGAGYLNDRLVEEKDNYDLQAFMLHALAAYDGKFKSNGKIPGRKFQVTAFDNLWKNRDQLNAYTRALLALCAHGFHFDDQAAILVQNLENGVVRDARPDQSILTGGGATNASPTVMGTAHWGADGVYWHWSDSGVEATAFALRALLAIDPTNQLVEPTVNWLVKNRRGAQWNNTRDTAIAVLALNDYLRVSGEGNPDLAFAIYVNGTKVGEHSVTGVEVFNAPSQFKVDPALIQDTNSIRIVRTRGAGPIYFAANARFFSTGEPITPAGNEIFVKREYYQLAGHPTLLKGYVYDREPLVDGGAVKSGDRVETVLTIEAKNDYDYLLFEDLKPAGFESVELRSGEELYARELKAGAVQRQFAAAGIYEIKAGDTLTYIARDHQVTVGGLIQANPGIHPNRLMVGAKLIIPSPNPSDNDADYTGRTRWVYQELRDRKVAMFIDHLPQGVWQIRYEFRAETPGKFHALPVLGQAMYVPEIRGNSAELRVNVTDRAP